jgi:hypothetical protein
MILPLAIAVGAWVIYSNIKEGSINLNPERAGIHAFAMRFVKDPAKLNKLADAYDREGLSVQAASLRKRAALPSLNPKVQATRQAALKAGLKSTNPVAVEKLATAFDKQGAGASADILKQYAAGLKVQATVPPVPVPMEALVANAPPVPVVGPEADLNTPPGINRDPVLTIDQLDHPSKPQEWPINHIPPPVMSMPPAVAVTAPPDAHPNPNPTPEVKI